MIYVCFLLDSTNKYFTKMKINYYQVQILIHSGDVLSINGNQISSQNRILHLQMRHNPVERIFA